MSRYERAYGTDWDSLDADEAIDRAYALGVAAALEEYHPEELEAVRNEVETAYDQSVVDLAFDEGRNEGRGIEGGDATWAGLVEDESAPVDERAVFEASRSGPPKAIDRLDALEKPSLDDVDAIDRPGFLDKE